jgi:ribose 5-phosphate isomerase RpiB
MKIAVACDHAGFVLKLRVIEELRSEGDEFIDLETNSSELVVTREQNRRIL